MPKLTMEVPHSLGQDEAVRRLKDKLREAEGAADDMHQEWHDHTLSFHFEVMGMKIQGTMAVEDKAVRVDVDLPLAAVMVKGMIQQRVQQELAAVLT